MPCICHPTEFPFTCPRHRARMQKRFYELCAGINCTPEQSARYRQAYAEGRGPGQQIHELQANTSLDCRWRGPVLRQVECRPCQASGQSRFVDVHACQQFGQCTLHNAGVRRDGAASPLVSVCATCPTRLQKPPATTALPAPEQRNPPRQNLVFNFRGNPGDCLQDSFRGASAFLVCGGPSLRELDLSLLNQRGIVIAAVNQAAATHVRPHLWFTVDAPRNFHEAIWRDPAIAKFTKRKYSNHSIRTRQGNEWKDAVGVWPRHLPNCWYYEHVSEWKPQEFLTSPRPTWGVTVAPNARSCMLVALRLLYWLGFRRVIVIGADFQMTADDPYAFHDPANDAKARSNNRLYHTLNEWFSELRPHFAEYGYEVLNATPGGQLNAFPRVSFEEAVRQCTSSVPLVETVVGHYR